MQLKHLPYYEMESPEERALLAPMIDWYLQLYDATQEACCCVCIANVRDYAAKYCDKLESTGINPELLAQEITDMLEERETEIRKAKNSTQRLLRSLHIEISE